MIGTEQAEYELKSIVFPSFFIHPDYAVYQPPSVLPVTDINWMVGCDFNVKPATDEWTAVEITINLALHKKDSGLKIAELIVTSTFHVKRGISFKTKYHVLCHLINQTIGHAQGAWFRKNRNVIIFSLIPPAYGKVEEEVLPLEKMVYEIWE